MRYFIIRADGLDAHFNQAVEATLMSTARANAIVLYLWRNDKTVFIGKNQNAFTECKIPRIEEDGGTVARRLTGGGAVYHDKGNLNFTFLAPRSAYSVSENFKIMTRGLKKLGFDARLSGRNDVVIDDRKFSGNAFYNGKDVCFHHGTILINADFEKLSDYLNVPKVKLEAKGVKSVVSRVLNLSEIDPSVTWEKVEDALIKSFYEYYGSYEELLPKEDLEYETLESYFLKFSDEKWIKGDDVYYDLRAQMRLEWGTADIRFKMRGTKITKARIYSDCLDTDAVELKEKLLVGADLYKNKEGVDDILEALREQKHEF